MSGFDLRRLQAEWRRIGITDKETAKMIGIRPETLSRNLKLPINECPLTANQAAIICVELGKPMDMFVTTKATLS